MSASGRRVSSSTAGMGRLGDLRYIARSRRASYLRSSHLLLNRHFPGIVQPNASTPIQSGSDVTVNAHKVIIAIAVRYLDAARVLQRNSTTADTFWEPQNHLFAMAAELALKAFLERAGVTEKELKRQDVRHSLKALLLLAISKGLLPLRPTARRR